MHLSSPTYLFIFLNPENEEHALYLVGESLPSIEYTIEDIQEKQVSWGKVFMLNHNETCITLAPLHQ